MSFEARDNLLMYFFKFVVAFRIYMTQASVNISKAEKFANIQSSLDEFTERITL